MTKEQARSVVLQVANAMLETVREAGPQGAPSGLMYAACNASGMSLEYYTAIMDSLERAGKIRKSGHVYYAI